MTDTVNSIYFARVLFSRKFAKMKRSRNCEITVPFTDIGKHAPNAIL